MALNEAWADVVGYEGLYIVSNLGQVKSVARISFGCEKKSIKERLLKPSFTRFGYKKVVLSKNKKLKTWVIHRLVSMAFIPNPDNKPQVNHIDANPANNCVDNLEWCTGSENMQHAIKLGRIKSKIKKTRGLSRGLHMIGRTNELHPQSKTVYQYSTDKTLVRIWPSTKEIIRSGIVGSHGKITDCCKGRIRGGLYKGYIWSHQPELT